MFVCLSLSLWLLFLSYQGGGNNDKEEQVKLWWVVTMGHRMKSVDSSFPLNTLPRETQDEKSMSSVGERVSPTR